MPIIKLEAPHGAADVVSGAVPALRENLTPTIGSEFDEVDIVVVETSATAVLIVEMLDVPRWAAAQIQAVRSEITQILEAHSQVRRQHSAPHWTKIRFTVGPLADLDGGISRQNKTGGA